VLEEGHRHDGHERSVTGRDALRADSQALAEADALRAVERDLLPGGDPR
jgi:hypothetical protein